MNIRDWPENDWFWMLASAGAGLLYLAVLVGLALGLVYFGA